MVNQDAEAAEQGEGSEHGFGEPLPPGVAPRDLRILWQAAVALGVGRIVQNVDDVRSANGLRIVDACVLPAEIVPQLFGALFGNELHVVFAAKFQAAGWTSFNAGGLEAFAYAIRAESAFIDALGCGIEARNIEGAPRDAEFAADAVFLIEVDDAVRVFNDGAVGGAGGETSGIGTVHALILAHQPLDGAVGILVLVEFDEVPKMGGGLGHRLVGVVEGGRSEGHVVPLDAGDFAGFASDACGGVD